MTVNLNSVQFNSTIPKVPSKSNIVLCMLKSFELKSTLPFEHKPKTYGKWAKKQNYMQISYGSRAYQTSYPFANQQSRFDFSRDEFPCSTYMTMCFVTLKTANCVVVILSFKLRVYANQLRDGYMLRNLIPSISFQQCIHLCSLSDTVYFRYGYHPVSLFLS